MRMRTDRWVIYQESMDPWRIITTYFSVRAETWKLQIWTCEPLSDRWSLLMCKDILKPVHWPLLCCSLKSYLSSTRLFIATCAHFSLKSLSMCLESVILFYFIYLFLVHSAHLHSSAFATYVVCILLHSWLKSSAQRQGHNHLFARILASTLKRGKLLLFPLVLLWKCLGFMTAQLQLKCTLFSTEGYIF